MGALQYGISSIISCITEQLSQKYNNIYHKFNINKSIFLLSNYNNIKIMQTFQDIKQTQRQSIIKKLGVDVESRLIFDNQQKLKQDRVVVFNNQNSGTPRQKLSQHNLNKSQTSKISNSVNLNQFQLPLPINNFDINNPPKSQCLIPKKVDIPLKTRQTPDYIDNRSQRIQIASSRGSMRIGQQKNLPKRPLVLSRKQSQKDRISKGYKQQKDLQKQQFYKYCKQQIIKVSKQNNQLKQQLQQKQQKINNLQLIISMHNQKISISNRQINSLKQQLKNKKKQIQHLQHQIQSIQKVRIGSFQNRVQYLGQRKTQLEREIRSKQFGIRQRDIKINQLYTQIKDLSTQNLRIVHLQAQNEKLRIKVGEITTEINSLRHKVYKKTPTIEHLWQVKNIQYNNILQLLETKDR